MAVVVTGIASRHCNAVKQSVLAYQYADN